MTFATQLTRAQVQHDRETPPDTESTEAEKAARQKIIDEADGLLSDVEYLAIQATKTWMDSRGYERVKELCRAVRKEFDTI